MFVYRHYSDSMAALLCLNALILPVFTLMTFYRCFNLPHHPPFILFLSFLMTFGSFPPFLTLSRLPLSCCFPSFHLFSAAFSLFIDGFRCLSSLKMAASRNFPFTHTLRLLNSDLANIVCVVRINRDELKYQRSCNRKVFKARYELTDYSQTLQRGPIIQTRVCAD